MSKISEIKEKINKCRLGLNPPLSEKEVSIFEKYLKIILPDDYKQFLCAVGNGGEGPYNGILPLDRWDDANNWPPGDDFALADPPAGTITICEQGCTYYALLVV